VGTFLYTQKPPAQGDQHSNAVLFFVEQNIKDRVKRPFSIAAELLGVKWCDQERLWGKQWSTN
jgi:hypothetical protein